MYIILISLALLLIIVGFVAKHRGTRQEVQSKGPDKYYGEDGGLGGPQPTPMLDEVIRGRRSSYGTPIPRRRAHQNRPR